MNSKKLSVVRHGRISHLLILIPLALSGFTHLWNPVGFPSIYVDEGHYMRRALQVLEGSGQQEASSAFTGYHPYDHPYLGQILLGFLLKVVGYPSILDPISGDVSSIQMLHLVPRILMGVLAVIDTFLVYKITRLRYNRTVALAASILFAVLPMTWLLRRILLDSILLPFLLSSILFAVRFNATMNKNGKHTHDLPVVLISGVFLGLAIFTKIPAICMIPLVGYLIITSVKHNKRWTIFGIWIIPVILIPLIWPAYAILYGQFDLWVDGVFSQTNRTPRSLFESMKFAFEIDPVLMTLGILGTVWMTIRKDYFFLLWVLPYIMFLGLIGYSQYIHMVLLLPVFSIAAAIIIQYSSNILRLSTTDLSNEFRLVFSRLSGKFRGSIKLLKSTGATGPSHHQRDMASFLGSDYVAPPHHQDMTSFLGSDYVAPPQRTLHSIDQQAQKLPKNTRSSSSKIFLLILTAVTIFGLISTSLLITIDVNGSLFEAYAALVEYLPGDQDTGEEGTVTLASSVKWGTFFYWIPKYVFDKELTFLNENSKEEPSTQKVITIGGESDEEDRDATSVPLGEVNNTARSFDYKKYPYSNMRYNELGDLNVEANH